MNTTNTINWYDVLDLDSSCSKDDIKKAYKKLVLKYHPDRPNGNAELFELINEAYEKIGSDSKRKLYDQEYKKNQNSKINHINLKQKYEKEYEDIKNLKTFDQARLDFENEFKQIKIEDPIKENEFKTNIDDLYQEREDDDIENIHTNLFPDKFDPQKFNELFNQQNTTKKDLTQYNSIGTFENTNFGFVDENQQNNAFGNQNIFTSINNAYDHYTVNNSNDFGNHNVIDDDYNKLLKERLKERELETEEFNNYKMDDYKPPETTYVDGILNLLDVDDVEHSKNELVNSMHNNKEYEKTLHETYIDEQTQDTLDQTLMTPQETLDTPQETLDTPQETLDTPQETLDTTQETLDTPQETLDTTQEPLHEILDTSRETFD